jgi:hypothetical protein
METTKEVNTFQSIPDIVTEVMNKHLFIDEYLIQPDIKTGKPIPTFIKLMSTILYLRQRLEFLVVPTESFYDYIERNDYTNFQNIEKVELYKILVCFVTLACAYINDSVEEVEDRDKMITVIRQYYYKNLNYLV